MEEDKSKLMDLADAFIRNEATMGIYYQACSEFVPEFADEWLLLSKQEHGHADAFRKIKASIQETPWSWSLGNYSISALEFVSSEVIRKIAEMQTGLLRKEYIVSFITDMENSGLEADLQKAFRTDLGQFNALLAKVVRESNVHRLMLVDISTRMTTNALMHQSCGESNDLLHAKVLA